MAVGRSILAVLGGVIGAGVMIALIEYVGHALASGEAVFGVAAAGYGVGALAGTFIATLIADRRAAVAVPTILAVLAAVNLFSFPHPVWFVPAAIAALALGWWAGASLGSQRIRRSHAQR